MNSAGGKELMLQSNVIRIYGKYRNMNDQPNNPLHGLTLEKILCDLVDHYGWDELYKMIELRCS